MKQSDQIKDTPLPSVFDQSWASFLNPAGRLRLNTLDFSDLWDEEDLGLDSTEEDGGPAQIPPLPPIPPPLPPSAPPLSRTSPKGRPPGCRTLRLHWRELQSLPPLPRVTRFGTQTIWAGLEPVNLDTNRLEYLFESKGNSAICSLRSGWRKQPLVSVLGVKRSNIITIALSSLPPPCLLPPAIYSMDTSVLDREDIQRLQALVPTEEELGLIREAQSQAPRSTLAPAELCLLTLGSISHLSSRLQLWAFTLDYDILEREIAEPLFHLKLAMEQLAASQTFRCILATVLAVGNFLNGCKARGFELSYLGKLSQVRDTHSRRPLLHHVCVLLLQLYPQSSDLHSDIAAVTRASKCDYSQVQANLTQLEALCKASWEQVRLLDRADEKRRGGEKEGGGTQEGKLRQRLPKFLKECEERLKVLRAVHRRVINRFHSFMLFLGYSKAMVRETKAEDFCKTVSDFSLEYRTTRLSILEQRERGRDLERGGRDLERGGRDLERGGRDLERGGQDLERGGRDLERGGRDLERGGQDLERGGRDLERGGRDLERGGRDLERGGRDLERGGRDLERGGRDLERGGRDLERGGRDRTPGTPGLHQKHPQTDQDHVPQSTLDEVLRTPESIFRLNLTLPRHRGKKIDIKSPFSRRPKW